MKKAIMDFLFWFGTATTTDTPKIRRVIYIFFILAMAWLAFEFLFIFKK